MEYFRIIVTLKGGKAQQGVREFPSGTGQQEAYFQVWRKAQQVYSDARIDFVKVERLPEDHPHGLQYLRKKAGHE